MRALVLSLALLAPLPVLAHEHGNMQAMPGMMHHEQSKAVEEYKGPAVGGAFSLVDPSGKRVTDKDLLGKYALVFFGYTFCPDICPTGLQTALDALDTAGDDIAKKVNTVFITIDPKRDTPEAMGKYAEQFANRIIALTGTDAEIATAAKAYKVYYAKAKDSAAQGDEYMMEHSSFTYLMGPDGKFIKAFGLGTDIDTMAKALKETVK